MARAGLSSPGERLSKLSLEVTFLLCRYSSETTTTIPPAPRGEWAGYRHCGDSPGDSLGRIPVCQARQGLITGRAPAWGSLAGLCTPTHLPCGHIANLFLNILIPRWTRHRCQAGRHGQTRTTSADSLSVPAAGSSRKGQTHIAGAVADEGIKILRLLPWVQCTMRMVRALQEGWG